MNQVPRRCLAGLLFALVIVSLVHLAPAQEKSVRPGINKPFENPDVKDFIGKFEVESREIFTRRKEIVVKEITSSGFKVVGKEKLLKENYFIRFERVATKVGADAKK